MELFNKQLRTREHNIAGIMGAPRGFHDDDDDVDDDDDGAAAAAGGGGGVFVHGFVASSLAKLPECRVGILFIQLVIGPATLSRRHRRMPNTAPETSHFVPSLMRCRTRVAVPWEGI